jgi:DNA-directed RNA polymerase II subunit RPB1
MLEITCKIQFDGDEMNIHLGQSIQARNELSRICNVKYQIIGAKHSGPIIGCIQDSVVGSYLLSQDENISSEVVSNLLSTTTSKTKFNIDKTKSYSGKELFSFIIPEDINSSNKVNIKNGKLLSGIIDKKQIGASKNSLIHYVWDKYGPRETQEFIDNTQRLAINYLMNKGLTISFGDMVISDELNDKVQNFINTRLLSATYQLTQFENDKENYNPKLLEELQSGELNSVASNIGKMISETMNDSNGLYTLVKSGSKGNTLQISQLAGCIGQINVEGKRIRKRVNNRSLPIFHQDDDTPMARGFIKSRFLDGLTGHELYFNTMAGREGLIDTALKTAQTGYIQRRIVKSLEDLSVRYDGLVRHANNSIIQFAYGNNNINLVKQTFIKLKLINMSNKDIDDNLLFTQNEIKQIKGDKIKQMNDNMRKLYIKFRNKLRDIYFVSTNNYKVIEEEFPSPINFNRIISDYKGSNKSNIKPEYIYDKINEIINSEQILMTSQLEKDEEVHKFLLKVSLYEYLSPKKVIFNYKISQNDFDKMVNTIKLSIIKGFVEPGEMVGVIAAQSIGEPTSQMTLNTKHSAGIAGKGSANMGVGRIEEILGFSKSIKTPIMTMYVDKKYDHHANKISSYFKYLTLRKLINSGEIIYDSNKDDHFSKLLKDDKVSNPFFINNKKEDLSLLPFVFRYVLNIEKMMDKESSLLDIKTKFITFWYRNFDDVKNIKNKTYKNIISNIDKLAILSNNDNIIHIRFRMKDFTYSSLTTFFKIVLDEIILKGINGIEDIDMTHSRRINFNKDQSVQIDKEYVISTSGINIKTINTIKGIDKTRTTTNDIYSIYKYYGIEAVTKVIQDELIATYAANGSGINLSHISLLTDFMTHIGTVISIDRNGLNKLQIDTLARTSFERQMDHFINGALFNESDNMLSVSSNIMVGKVFPGGTGCFDIMMDTDKLKRTEYIDNETGGRTTFIPFDKEGLFEDLINNDNINFDDMFIPK